MNIPDKLMSKHISSSENEMPTHHMNSFHSVYTFMKMSLNYTPSSNRDDFFHYNAGYVVITSRPLRATGACNYLVPLINDERSMQVPE